MNLCSSIIAGLMAAISFALGWQLEGLHHRDRIVAFETRLALIERECKLLGAEADGR